MNSSQAIENLYKIIAERETPLEAKNLITAVVSNVLSDLQENGQAVTAQAIDEGLSKYADDFMEAAKKKPDVA
jgi:hypothetical protein